MSAVPLSSWVLETSKDGSSTISMGNVFHCTTGPLGKFYLCLILISQDTVCTAGHSWQKTKSYLDCSKNGKHKMSKNKQTFGNRLTKTVYKCISHATWNSALTTGTPSGFLFSKALSVSRTEERLWYSDTPSDRIKLHENNQEDIKQRLTASPASTAFFVQ